LAAEAQTPSRRAPSPSPATSTGRPSGGASRLAAERAGQRAVRGDATLSRVEIHRVHAAELELDPDLAVGGGSELERLDDERLSGTVQAGGADLGHPFGLADGDRTIMKS
jgi:hypothetical protein